MVKVTPQGRRREAAIEVAAMTDLDPQVKAALINNILSRDSMPALQNDKVVYRIVVAALGGIGLCAILAAVILLMSDKPRNTTTTKDGTTTVGVGALPEIFLSLGSVAVGALAGVVSAPQLSSGGSATNTGAVAIPATATKPIIGSVEPTELGVGMTDLELTLVGSSIGKDSVVTVNDQPRSATFGDDRSLTVTLEPGDVAAAGTLNVRVQTGELTSDPVQVVVS